MSQPFPTHRADLLPTDYNLVFDAIPNALFSLQTVNMPGVTANPTTTPTPLGSTYQWYGEKLTYEEFTISFIVDEDLANYEELYHWMLALTNSQNSNQFWTKSQDSRAPDKDFYNATLFFLDANKNPKKKIIFHNTFPIAISSFDMDYSNTDPETVLATATFTYDYFTIE